MMLATHTKPSGEGSVMALCVRTLSVLATTIGLLVPPVPAIAGNPAPYADTQIISTNQTFKDLWSNL